MDSSPSEAKRKSDQVSEKDEGRVMKEQTNNAEANNTIRHISGNMNSNDLYALPNKRKGSFSNAVKVEEDVTEDDEEEFEKGRKEEVEGIEDKDANKDLPPGWEKHEGVCRLLIKIIAIAHVMNILSFLQTLMVPITGT